MVDSLKISVLKAVHPGSVRAEGVRGKCRAWLRDVFIQKKILQLAEANWAFLLGDSALNQSIGSVPLRLYSD